MLKLISALLSFFLFAQVASAQATTYAQSQFLTTYSAQGVVGCNGDPNQNYGLIFAPGTSMNNISTVTTAAASFNWAQVAPAPPVVLTPAQAIANVSQLEVDLWNDSTTKPIIGNLIVFYPLLEKNLSLTASAQDNLMCQEFWIGLKASPPAWLTAPVIAAIEAHAAADNVALVAP